MPGRKPPDHPITSPASVCRTYWLLVREPGFRRLYLRLIKNIFRIYFLPQFIRPRGLARVPLDMELDALIPFDRTWLPCYMGFTRLWIGSVGWLHARFGKRALPEIESFIVGLESLFLASHKVFSRLDSTLASRPGPVADLDSLLIHLSDRNSFCFPSLHVMIVKYNADKLGAILDRLARPGEDFSAEKAFLRERAARIVESILYVKQHSVSDIPAGLFLLSALGSAAAVPARDREDDLRFMEGLFADGDADGIGDPAADPRALHGRKLRTFMDALYRKLHAEHARGREPHAVLLEFLGRYEEEVGKLLKDLG